MAYYKSKLKRKGSSSIKNPHTIGRSGAEFSPLKGGEKRGNEKSWVEKLQSPSKKG